MFSHAAAKMILMWYCQVTKVFKVNVKVQLKSACVFAKSGFGLHYSLILIFQGPVYVFDT